MTKTNLFSHTHSSLRATLVTLGAKAFLADQIFDWVYRKFEFNPARWTNVSAINKEFVAEHFTINLPTVFWHGLSSDGTRKFLIKMSDAQTVEAVAIPGKSRLTLCLSSQVGCAMGCTFCHTGTQGLKRHLSIDEVVGQYLLVTRWLKDHVSEEARLTNIVYMGQGEPLHNFENMKAATEIFLETKGLGLGQRKITLSTSGLAPQIEKLADFPPINLAISLHSPRDEVRSQLMPVNKAYNLQRLFEAIKKVPLKGHRRITYEYLLIDGLTDTAEDVELLCDLLERKESKINLIPFNEYPGAVFKRPSDQRVLWFQHQLIDRGFTSTIRVTKGDDILAACGQLKTALEKINVWDEGDQSRINMAKKKSIFSFVGTSQEKELSEID